MEFKNAELYFIENYIDTFVFMYIKYQSIDSIFTICYTKDIETDRQFFINFINFDTIITLYK